MAAILDMDILGQSIRGLCKNNLRGLDEYWQLESVWVNVVLEMQIEPMSAILNMQIS